MNQFPDWIPEMVNVSPWTADTFDILYTIFSRDFKETKPIYQGFVVWHFPELDDGKEKVFWHLTHQEDNDAGERLPDLRRSERLPWVRKMIDNSNKEEILHWDYKEGRGTIHTYIWLKDYDFLVIMKKYPDGRRRIITSFFIEYNNYRIKTEKKYSKRIK
jgi:hypothetical protein